MCTTCFGLYLGHPQDCQYKYLTNLNGLLFTVAIFKVKTYNIQYKSIIQHILNVYIETFVRFISSCIVERVRIKIFYDFFYFNLRGLVSCSLFFHKVHLLDLFANCGPGYNLGL